MYLLRTLGGLSLEQGGQLLPELSANRKALVLLAILASEGSVARDRLLALLWPESDSAHARGALRQTLHLIRHTMGMGDVVRGSVELSLDPRYIQSDVGSFIEAVQAHDAAAAVELHRGPFLDAVHLSNAPEFERWLDQRRDDLGRDYAAALEELAEAAEAREDFSGAAGWWRARQAIDPTNGVVAGRLIRALDAAGERAAALRHAQLHESVLLHEFELPPDPAVAALAQAVRNNEPAIHVKSLERLAARVPGLRNRRHPVMALFAAAAVAVLIMGAGMIAALTVSSSGPRRISAAPVPPNEARALEYLLKGQALLKAKNVEATRQAKSYFSQAVSLDPTLTDAYVALADVELAPALTDPSPRVARAKAWAERAFEADSNSAAVHTLKLWIATIYDRDFAAADRHFRRAYQLDPAFPGLYNAYSVYLLTLGRPEESLRALLHAFELRPDATPNLAYVAVRYVLMNKPAEARRFINRALAQDSSFFMTHWALGRLLLNAGDYDGALREFAHPGTDLAGIGQQAFLGYTLARAGRTQEARDIVAGMLEQRRNGGFVAPSDLAIVYTGLGEVAENGRSLRSVGRGLRA